VYQLGRNAFEGGVLSDDNPYERGSKSASDRRLAWFSGWFDAWRESRERYYDELAALSRGSK